MRDAESIASAHQDATRALDDAERTEARSGAPPALAAAGDASIRRMIVATQQTALNLRSGPEFGQNVIGELGRGRAVQVETGEATSGFLHLNDGTREGWAAAHFLRDESAPKAPHHAAATPHAVAPAAHAVAPQASPAKQTAKALAQTPTTTTGAKVSITPAVITGIQKVPDSKHETLVTGDAFEKEPGDASDIDPYDIHQGGLGDCYFLSACAAVARANPEAIRKLIKKVDDHTYDVTLYETKAGPHFWSSDVKASRVIRVSTAFETDANGQALYAQSVMATTDGPELWPRLLEKAYAIMVGGYATEGKGGNLAQGLNALVAGGTSTHNVSSKSPEANASLIHQALVSHHPVTAALDVSANNGQTWRHELSQKYAWFDHVFGDDPTMMKEQKRIDELNVVSNHAYSVKSVDPEGKKISLQNPWHKRHIDDLALVDFNLIFDTFCIVD